MLVGQNLFCLLALYEVNDIVCAEVLLQCLHSLQHDDELLLSLNLRLRMQTVVAVMAVVGCILLTEIVQQHLTATDRCLCVGCCLSQQLSADVLFGNRFALHKLIQLLQVFLGIEGDAHTLAAVTSCTSRLLVVALQRLRNVVVDDKTHVGLVNTHAEGDGSHDDVNLLHQEVILCLRAQCRLQTCMVGSRLDVVSLQYLCQFLHLLTRQTVDDAALSRVLLDEFDDVLVHIHRLGAHLIVQVRAVERALELCGIYDA